jgi:hypothetical protein
MAKCDLLIELDDPEAEYPGGGTITGVVHVQVDADVHCKRLEVQSVWRTHGRGNVATGTAGSVTLFAGEWRAGERHEYRFELPIAQWPPTYHGHYLNVDHSVDARAKIPWGSDPKASQPFLMRPSCGPEGAMVVKPPTQAKGVVGCLVGIAVLAFLIGFAAVLAQAGAFALLFLLLPLSGFLIWFFRVFLPRFVLGEVQHRFSSETFSPGELAKGELVIRPRKQLSINGVTLQFQAREQCVSGSGSNRSTHKHVLLDRLDTLQGATTLAADQQHRFELSVQLPEQAPYSLELTDNQLIWSATLRVDIPRWPDWVKEIPLRVVPSRVAAPRQTLPAGGDRKLAQTASSASEYGSSSGGGITFQETAHHLWSVRADRGQVEALTEAVTGLTLELEAVVERRLLFAGEDDPHVYPDGYAVWAHFTDPELPLVLYVPRELADEFEQLGHDAWRGLGTIVGWDSLHERLQVKLEPPS